MQIIEQIAANVERYEREGEGWSIGNLLTFQDNLAVKSYRLAELAAQLKADYNKDYFIRRITVSKTAQRLINDEGYSKARAEIEAITEAEMLYDTESDSEAAAYRADLLLKQVNRILHAVSQRISYLKQESEQTKKQDMP